MLDRRRAVVSYELEDDELPTVPPPAGVTGPCRELFCGALADPGGTRCGRHTPQPSTLGMLFEADALFAKLPVAAE